MKKTNGSLNPPDNNKIPINDPIAYPANDDIYNKSRNVDENNPDDITTLKENGEMDAAETGIEENFKDEPIGSNLDIPGSELDDQQENIGSEDEENNYYSLGGDNHIELEEN